MSVTVPWLPSNAIAEAASALNMREVIADWSAKWLGRGGATLSGMEVASSELRMPADGLELDDGLVLMLPDGASTSIGRLMFGTPEGEPTVADLAAISAAVDKSLLDLRQNLAQIFGLPRDSAWRARNGTEGPGHLFRVRLGQTIQPLVIFVADHLLIRRIKMRLRPNPAARPLGSIAHALAPNRVTVSALLGSCRVSVRELAELQQGDVVVLDSDFEKPVTIAIDHRPQSASCRVAAGAHHLDLTLV